MWRLDEETKEELIKRARSCETEEEFSIGESWSKWMDEFVNNWTDEELIDGEMPSEKTIDEIDKIIFEIFEESRKLSDEDVLMLDGCTESEAENHIKRGTLVYEGEDFEENFEDYMEEWGVEEEDILKYKDMIEKKIPVKDWGIVEKFGKTYYIAYVL